ncbi:hypothetical protein [Echinicola sp. 20G]|uniref:pirin family protein n=1 Tax=Echinicola sp. 20G TaxID=2781961 RepID=UPI00190FD5FC|nr:hypothetical protein [Echinicola sp. 20G]
MNQKNRIRLARERTLDQSDSLQRFWVIDPKADDQSMSQPFSDLKSCQDSLLLPGKSNTYSSTDSFTMLLVPLTGNIIIEEKKTGDIELGTLLFFKVSEGQVFRLINPNKNTPVNFLLIELIERGLNESRILRFDNVANRLNETVCDNHKLSSYQYLKISMGEFKGRTDINYYSPFLENDLFVLVLSGAFEVNDCLLSTRDALSLVRTSQLEMESLSNNAFVLVLDINKS